MNLSLLDQIRNKDGDPLFDFQKEGVKAMIKRKHNLLADEPGLGKSAQAIALADVLGLRCILVITKASLKTGFKKHLENWAVYNRVTQVVAKKTELIEELAEVVIVNYDIIHHSYIHQQLCDRKWDLIICDEAHALKNMDAKRTKAILAKNAIIHKAERTLMITGTPVLNRPIELYPILKVLAPQVMAPYNDFFKFAKRYCDAWQDGFTFNTKGASHTEELNIKLRQHYMIRRMEKDVDTQLPSRRHEMVFIDSTDGVRSKLRILAEATRGDFKHQSLDAAGGELSVLRRETAQEKVILCNEILTEAVEANRKTVIFAYHHSVINELSRTLIEFEPIVFTGMCTALQRDEAINQFKNNPRRKVFIGQIQASGEGIDGLQEVCHNIIFAEWSWVPGEIEQAIKRLHRIGQKEKVLVRFLIWADSIEEHMLRVALDKVKVIREITK